MHGKERPIDDSRGHSSDSNRRHLTYAIFHNVIATDKYCLFDQSGNPIQDSVLWRGKAGVDQKFPCGNLETMTPSKKSKKKLATAVWIRYCHFFHFGHLLTETCSALFPLILWREAGLDIEPINILMHYQFRKSIEDIKKLLNISGENIHIYGPSAAKDFKIKQLYIPYPTIALKDYSGKDHPYVTKKFLDLWAPKFSDPLQAATQEQKGKMQFGNYFEHESKTNDDHRTGNNRLWISRSQLAGNSRALAEEAHIEKKLYELGWNIIHPQQHSIGTQLNAIERSKIVAGIEGSAFHLLYGIKDTKKLVILLTWRDHKGGPFDIQLQSQGFKYHLVRCLHLSTGASTFRHGYDVNAIITLITRLDDNHELSNSFKLSAI